VRGARADPGSGRPVAHARTTPERRGELSASSLVDSDLPKRVASMLAAGEVSPRSLNLQIPEECVMANRDRARSVLNLLRRTGVQISMDDFGASYISLNHLQDPHIDEAAKLDRSFILPISEGHRTAVWVAVHHRPGAQPRPRQGRRRPRDRCGLHRADPPGLRSGAGLLHVQGLARRSALALGSASAALSLRAQTSRRQGPARPWARCAADPSNHRVFGPDPARPLRSGRAGALAPG
jgi:hypothetical protein